MDERAMKKHEEKLAEMRKQFKACRRRSRLWWVIWAIVSEAALYLVFAQDVFDLFMDEKFNIFIALTIFNMMLSLTILSFQLKQWNQQEAKQEQLIIEQAPVGSVRISRFDD